MNHDAAALQCCEKLSQQIQRIFKETEEKESQQKEWKSKKEETRLKTNKLRFLPPINLNEKIRECQLNAKAYRSATREIEAVGQRYREKWRRSVANKQLPKEIDLERNKLIDLEIEIDLFKQKSNKGVQNEKESRVPLLIKEFTTKFSKLKSCLTKFELMLSRYELSLNDVISEDSQVKLLVAELQTRFQERLNQEDRFTGQQRTYAIAPLTENYIRYTGEDYAQTQNTLEYYNKVDEEILKERLLNEREANNQLETVLTYARKWLLQEEHFKKEVAMLQVTH